jgi:hypothetical protein
MVRSGLVSRSAAHLHLSDPELEFEMDAFGTSKEQSSFCLLVLLLYEIQFIRNRILHWQRHGVRQVGDRLASSRQLLGIRRMLRCCSRWYGMCFSVQALESSRYHRPTVGHLPLQPLQNALRADILAGSLCGLPNRGFSL